MFYSFYKWNGALFRTYFRGWTSSLKSPPDNLRLSLLQSLTPRHSKPGICAGLRQSMHFVIPLDSGYSSFSTTSFNFPRPYSKAVKRDLIVAIAASKISLVILVLMAFHVSVARSSHSSFWKNEKDMAVCEHNKQYLSWHILKPS